MWLAVRDPRPAAQNEQTLSPMGHISQCRPGGGLGSTAGSGDLSAVRRTNQGIGPGVVGNVMALMLISEGFI